VGQWCLDTVRSLEFREVLQIVDLSKRRLV
jgi:hypothetical protein